MSAYGPVVVYGATGHTGRFIVNELVGRGFAVRASGRDNARLQVLAAAGGNVRPAAVDDAEALDWLLAGATAVVNCAGPFAVTASPLVEAALRAGLPYVDISAEIEANAAMFAEHSSTAQNAGVCVVPAMAFYGGLGDLLVTAAMGDWPVADEVHIAYGLSSWHPTAGTRAAGRTSHERAAAGAGSASLVGHSLVTTTKYAFSTGPSRRRSGCARRRRCVRGPGGHAGGVRNVVAPGADR